MRQKRLKISENIITKSIIDKEKICLSRDYLIFYETEIKKYPVFLFFEHKNFFYPVNYYEFLKKNLEKTSEIKGIIFNNLITLIDFVTIFVKPNSLNFIEKIQISKIITKNKIADYYDFFNVNDYIKYENLLTLRDEIIKLLAMNMTSPDIAMQMNNLKQREYEFFITLIKEYKLTQSQQREILEGLNDKSIKIDDINKKETIKNREILMGKIKEYTMPEFTQMMKLFKNYKNKLNLPKKINLVETPYFESKNLKLEMFFKSYDELMEKIKLLSENIKSKKEIWGEIFKIL